MWCSGKPNCMSYLNEASVNHGMGSTKLTETCNTNTVTRDYHIHKAWILFLCTQSWSIKNKTLQS